MNAVLRLLLFVVLSTASSAAAAPDKPVPTPEQLAALAPMRVYLVRSAHAGCEPNCPEWIAAQGRIDAQAVKQFRAMLRTLGTRRLPVLLNSPGGDVEHAYALGRLIRQNGLDVAVARTVFEPCDPAAKACRKKQPNGVLRGSPQTFLSVCASACAFVLAAGSRRVVGPWSMVGVHQFKTFNNLYKVLRTYRVTMSAGPRGPVIKRRLVSERRIFQRTVPGKTAQRHYEKSKRYFLDMGIADSIMAMIADTPNSDVYWLTPTELTNTRLATEATEASQLVGIAPPQTAPASPAGAAVPTGAAPPSTPSVAEPPPKCGFFDGRPIVC